GFRFVLKVSGGGSCTKRGPVGSLLGECLVDVGCGQNSGWGIEHCCRRRALVAAAVEPLAVPAYEGCECGQAGRLGEDALAVVGVEAYAFPFGGAEWRWFVPDPVRDADSAEVVEETGVAQAESVFLREPDRCSFAR